MSDDFDRNFNNDDDDDGLFDDDIFGNDEFDDEFGGMDDGFSNEFDEFDEFDNFDNNEIGDFDNDPLDEFDSGALDDQLSFLDEDDEFDDLPPEEGVATAEGEGNNRTFLYAMGAMIVLFILGLGLIAFLATGGFGGGQAQQTQVAFEASSTFIANENATREAQIAASQTAAVENQTATIEAAFAGTQTAEAEQQATNRAEVAATATQAVVGLTETAEAIQQATSDAAATATEAIVQATEGAAAGATETEIAAQQTLNPPEIQGEPVVLNGQPVLTATGSPVVLIDGEPFAIVNNEPVAISANAELQTSDGTPVQLVDGLPVAADSEQPMPTAGEGLELSDVQQTATALAQIFDATPTQEDVTSGNEGQGGGFATAVPLATQDPGIGGGGSEALPDTGLFDDVFGGSPVTIILLALGLFGVIIVSRSLRSSVNRD